MSRFFLMILVLLAMTTGAHADDAKPDVSATEKMSPWEYGIGGVLGIYPGFGLGHVVQGRWLHRGWIFTAGESASVIVLAIGAAECVEYGFLGSPSSCNNGLVSAGIFGFVVFKIWEVVDI